MSVNNNQDTITIEIPRENVDAVLDMIDKSDSIITDRMARIFPPKGQEEVTDTEVQVEIEDGEPYVTFFTENGEELSPYARDEKLQEIEDAEKSELLYDELFDGYNEGYTESVSITPISAPFVHPINRVVAGQTVIMGLLVCILCLTLLNTIKSFFGGKTPTAPREVNSVYRTDGVRPRPSDEPTWQSVTTKKPETDKED